MAKKFFNRKIKKKKNSFLPIIIIVGCALIILLLIVLILNASKNKMPKDAIIKIRESVSVIVNGSYPDKTTFFSELKNVPESAIDVKYDNANLKVPGEYTININVYNKKYTSKLIVIDNIAPVLVLKNINIKNGTIYQPSDFVESCIDNSGSECVYEFYTNAKDSKGNIIDFSSYTKNGTYIIMVIAKDKYGNTTEPMEVELTISKDGGSNTTLDPECPNPPCNTATEECLYGGNDIAKGTHISIDITQNGCAVDINLYNEDTFSNKAQERINLEQEKLEKEFKNFDLNVTDIHLNANATPVLNSSGNGFVGYLINIEVYIIRNNEKETLEKYYIDETGARVFSINRYNLSN